MEKSKVKYKISHVTTYEYDSVVPVCQNIVCLTPRNTETQSCLRHRLSVRPEPTSNNRRIDYFGNSLVSFSVDVSHTQLRISSSSTIRTSPREISESAVSPPWESVRDMLPNNSTKEGLSDFQFVFPSDYVPTLAPLQEYVKSSFEPRRPILDAVLELNSRIHKDFQYDPRATTVNTPVEQVFELRRGVCQDLAHLMIAGLRSLGLAARYVSGYLRTHPPEGQPKLTGADASHAWVSVFAGELGWIDVDPTNNMLPNTDHITIGWGRDYKDVCPVSGMYIGGGNHRLTVAVDVSSLDGS